MATFLDYSGNSYNLVPARIPFGGEYAKRFDTFSVKGIQLDGSVALGVSGNPDVDFQLMGDMTVNLVYKTGQNLEDSFLVGCGSIEPDDDTILSENILWALYIISGKLVWKHEGNTNTTITSTVQLLPDTEYYIGGKRDSINKIIYLQVNQSIEFSSYNDNPTGGGQTDLLVAEQGIAANRLTAQGCMSTLSITASLIPNDVMVGLCRKIRLGASDVFEIRDIG